MEQKYTKKLNLTKKYIYIYNFLEKLKSQLRVWEKTKTIPTPKIPNHQTTNYYQLVRHHKKHLARSV